MRSSGGVNAEIAEPMPFIRKLAVATVKAEADRFDDNVVPSARAPTYQEVADALNARGVHPLAGAGLLPRCATCWPALPDR